MRSPKLRSLGYPRMSVSHRQRAAHWSPPSHGRPLEGSAAAWFVPACLHPTDGEPRTGPRHRTAARWQDSQRLGMSRDVCVRPTEGRVLFLHVDQRCLTPGYKTLSRRESSPEQFTLFTHITVPIWRRSISLRVTEFEIRHCIFCQ